MSSNVDPIILSAIVPFLDPQLRVSMDTAMLRALSHRDFHVCCDAAKKLLPHLHSSDTLNARDVCAIQIVLRALQVMCQDHLNSDMQKRMESVQVLKDLVTKLQERTQQTAPTNDGGSNV
jgi:thiamine kinase-like enzyme